MELTLIAGTGPKVPPNGGASFEDICAPLKELATRDKTMVYVSVFDEKVIVWLDTPKAQLPEGWAVAERRPDEPKHGYMFSYERFASLLAPAQQKAQVPPHVADAVGRLLLQPDKPS